MDTMHAWMFLTRWGNSLLLLPAASCICIGLWADGERRVASRWALCFGAAVLVVFATKIAFLGWGIGSRTLDFTGISGHSMLAAAVLPMLGWWVTQERSARMQRNAMIAGSAVAGVVGASRLLLSAHSVSEVVIGLALGSAVAWFAIPRGATSSTRSWFRWAVLAAVLVAGAVSGVGTSGQAHGLVTQLALHLSGRSEVFTREML